MSPVLYIDFETRSAADLREVGLHNYATHPTTDVWCMAWAFGPAEPEIWAPGAEPPPAVLEHVRSGGTVVAHNAPFEIAIWNNVLSARDARWPALDLRQCVCTMVTGYAMGLPGSLEEAARAMGLAVRKDIEGRALMLRMARPRRRNADGTFLWWDEPEKKQRLYEYCSQDVRVERELHERLVPLSQHERRVWCVDWAINNRGVHFDRASVEGAVRAVRKLRDAYDARMAALTDGAVASTSSLAALKEWAAANGVPLESAAKDALADAIAAAPPGRVRDALLLRQEAGKASVAKLDVMLSVAGPDNRLRNMYQMNGAGTGRWAGRAVQPHNLTRDVPEDPEQVEHILSLFRAGEVDAIDMLYGPPLAVLSRCLRPLLTAAPGHVLVGGDWSNVEGRGVAWFCGEEWKLRAFREFDAGTGPDLYKVSYARTFAVPVESVTKAQRQIGKVEELAFGYQGGVGAFRTMGGARLGITDAQADEFKRGWRSAHPNVVRTWRRLEEAAIEAVRAPGSVTQAGAPGRAAKFKVAGSFLWCLLPSGRAICYPYPKLLDGTHGPMLTYMTSPSPDDFRKGRVVHDPGNSSTWARVGTYGGSLLENIVQAFCADFLRALILAAEEAGYPVVLHTHDDCMAEVPEAQAEEARAWFERAMRTPPAWAEGFPLHADIGVSKRYGY